MRNAYKALAGKPKGKGPLRRPKRLWENNIRMDIGDTGWEVVDWINLNQSRDKWRDLLNTAINPHKRREFSRLAEGLLDFQGLFYVELDRPSIIK
jgi:hypothetical protein